MSWKPNSSSGDIKTTTNNMSKRWPFTQLQSIRSTLRVSSPNKEYCSREGELFFLFSPSSSSSFPFPLLVFSFPFLQAYFLPLFFPFCLSLFLLICLFWHTLLVHAPPTTLKGPIYLLPTPAFASFFDKHVVSFSFGCSHLPSVLLF
jgi:hypothetical protein